MPLSYLYGRVGFCGFASHSCNYVACYESSTVLYILIDDVLGYVLPTRFEPNMSICISRPTLFRVLYLCRMPDAGCRMQDAECSDYGTKQKDFILGVDEASGELSSVNADDDGAELGTSVKDMPYLTASPSAIFLTPSIPRRPFSSSQWLQKVSTSMRTLRPSCSPRACNETCIQRLI